MKTLLLDVFVYLIAIFFFGLGFWAFVEWDVSVLNPLTWGEYDDDRVRFAIAAWFICCIFVFDGLRRHKRGTI